MDSIPSYEFHGIFQRLTTDVNLKGALTAEEIDERLNKARKRFKAEAEETHSRSEKKILYKKAKAIKTLMERDFSQRTIAEAYQNPYGIVNLTLRFGTKKAKEMKLAIERARLRRRGITVVRVRRARKKRRFR